VEWREGWDSDRHVVHTGYWSLVAALDRGTYTSVVALNSTSNRVFFHPRGENLALEEGIPITDPSFYASEERCPDDLIEHVFRVAPQAREGLPLLPERIAIMREVGAILCTVSPGCSLFL
jgi:hypothetical protein